MIAIPVAITIVVAFVIQEKIVELLVKTAYSYLYNENKNILKNTIEISYQNAFSKNIDLMNTFFNSDGLKTNIKNLDKTKIDKIFEDQFAITFAMNDIVNVLIFDKSGKYLTGDGITETNPGDFADGLNKVKQRKQPYRFINCAHHLCQGVLTIPLMLDSRDIGYVVVVFDISSVFSDLILDKNIHVYIDTEKHIGADNIENLMVFKLPNVDMSDNAYVYVENHSDKLTLIINKLQYSLLLSNLIGGFVIVLVVYYLIAYRTRDISQISNMIVDLIHGDRTKFSKHYRRSTDWVIQIEEVTQIRKNTEELSKQLDSAVEESIKREIAERIIEEKKNILAKASRDFEVEKKRLALEFHDDLGQRMVALRFSAALLRKMTNIDDVVVMADKMSNMITKMENSVTSILDGLHPPLIDTLGVVGAINAIVEEMNYANNNKVFFGIHVSEELESMETAIQVAVFRLVQESISNALKYAAPSKIDIDIGVIVIDSAKYIRGTIKNDGIGFNVHQHYDGMGLSGMHDRVSRLNGELIIDSNIDSPGTVIEFLIPIF